ncbi:cycloartenol-C-24-methyltransferase [Sphaeroforma arctica JP610]|uniref:Methyltransferase n=1 Tax=Sphaeroforma arctica JP610 TaxID=667725 RepID=A0A0L0FRM4_9EUKA|nr:cycloartenol-C-24-methyltransferase [Sphaeroforma arctica JP610]KNC79477.1 cycloartenol-C-24-methyltransferase [Sphaeroforma arctica JP610]|eukprot:XP_014153379.1 cycloartenol-C-24-methyltransferase [Sphaeroforma arctica JP610]
MCRHVSEEYSEKIGAYEKYHTEHGGDIQARRDMYADMVNKYYDLATDFYEWGWGTSFHFAHRLIGETHNESIKRHEHYLAHKLRLEPGMKVLDVGCGVGGPLREIASFSGASITGLNNNAYQIQRGTAYNVKSGHDKSCDFMKADFMHVPMPNCSFDAIYQIEATCHAPDKFACYAEIFRLLKPGQCFGGYDWCMTHRFDPDNIEHVKIKSDIEIGNGLPDVLTTKECLEALKKAGFEIIEFADLADTATIPWYEPFQGSYYSLSNFRSSMIGRFVTKYSIWSMEKLGLAPEGTGRTAAILETAAHGLVAGGEQKLFTPMFFYLAKKPMR